MNIPRRSSQLNLMRQTHYMLRKEINIYGCFFRSLAAIAESWLGERLNAWEINELYEQATKDCEDPMMSTNCTVHPPGAGNGIPLLAFKMLGDPEYWVRQIGSREKGKKPKFWAKGKVHRTILWGVTKEEPQEWRHYRLGDEKGREIFDPDPTAVVIREVTQLLYEVTKL